MIVILVASRICAKAMAVIGLPKVLGEMIAGIVLGPTCFGHFFPDAMQGLFTADVRSLLTVLSGIGLSVYMFLVGMDMSALDRKSFSEVSKITAAGFLAPFILGLLCSGYLYSQITVGQPLSHFAFFMAIALSVTSIPMLARILEERNLHKSKLGTLTLMAASFDDAAAWCLLSVVIAVAKSKGLLDSVLTTVLSFLFLAAVYFILKPVLRRLLRKDIHEGGLKEGKLALVMSAIMIIAWISESIGVTSVIGCFLLGTVIPDLPVFKREINKGLHGITTEFFIPVYFILSGLNADLSNLFKADLFIPFVIILAASFIGKYCGCALMMRKMGYSWHEASALGGLMNARGLMGLVVAGIGLQYGLIPQSIYSLLVLTAVVTTAISIPIFNISMSGIFKRSKAISKAQA